MSLDLIHRNDALLVANKPAGLLAVPGRGEDKQDCLSSRVQQEFPDALIVHRLDMATSGLIVFGRGAEMQSRLSQMFRERLVAKRYVAVVTGKLESPENEIDLPLNSDWPNRPKQKVDMLTGKPSLTRYRLLAYDADTDTSRVELEPVTGRTHQLRVHLAAIGHPILGDSLYGTPLSSAVMPAQAGIQPVQLLGSRLRGNDEAMRLLLHACSLSFTHPRCGKMLSLTSAPPF